MKLKSLFIPIAGVLALMGFGRRSAQASSAATFDCNNPPPGAWFASIPGYRRARSDEVTPEMSSAAVQLLYRPVGSVYDAVDGDSKFAVESHCSQAKGWHKGVSVFVRIS